MSALSRDLVPMRGHSVRRGEVGESGCGQVLLGAASDSRASPAGWGKLKQENVFYGRVCCKDSLKLMGVSMQNLFCSVEGCVCV